MIPKPKRFWAQKTIPQKMYHILKNYVLVAELVPIRAVLFFILSVALYLWNIVLSKLVKMGKSHIQILYSLHKTQKKKMVSLKLVKLCNSIICRAILLVLGFSWIEEKVKSTSGKLSSGSKPQMKGGDIVLCNHSSYIDQIYLTYLFGNPIFTSIPSLEEPVSSFFFWRSPIH